MITTAGQAEIAEESDHAEIAGARSVAEIACDGDPRRLLSARAPVALVLSDLCSSATSA
jgi:hypothetical protein